MLDPKEILTSLADRFATTGKVQNVFGEPIEAHGKIIIPVASVKYGLGAGGGGENKTGSEDAVGGSGGGGGVKVTPLGVIEVTEPARASFVSSIRNSRRVWCRRSCAGIVVTAGAAVAEVTFSFRISDQVECLSGVKPFRMCHPTAVSSRS